MSDHTFAGSALTDTTKSGAVTETQTDTLLAGKYKSKEDLIEATAEIYQKIEGKTLSPSEILSLASKEEKDLELVYKGYERQFHSRPSTTETEEQDPYAILDQWASQRGYVRKEELMQREYEENELNSYFTQNPEAKSREQLIKTLAQTDGFKDKSFVEVDRFITSQLSSSAPAVSSSPASRMGSSIPTPTKDISSMSDDEFLQTLRSQTPRANMTR